MAPLVALLTSPLLGPSVWDPVAQELAARGRHTVIGTATSVRSAEDVLESYVAQLPRARGAVLVAHSNAGAYVPALMKRRHVVASVFVDAVLPPRRGHVPLAPPELLDALRAMADANGVLPPWNEWWDEGDAAGLYPDAETRAHVEREQKRLPLSYFEQTMPVWDGWDELPAGYLAFGDTYARERDDAARRHWQVRTVPGTHLHQLIDPVQVAAELDAFIGVLIT
jgi:hypothetical protein